jgi:serine phosphatase RsbU (regulator of sigma subunit)
VRRAWKRQNRRSHLMHMLELKDLYLLPEVEPLIGQIKRGWVGLGIVAGLDARPLVGDEPFPPSGHSTLFRVLVRDILLDQPGTRTIVVARSEDAIRLPRPLLRRIQFLEVESTAAYDESIADAAARRPDLLVVDRLTAESARAALCAASSGLRVLSQLDTVLRGAEVARLLSQSGMRAEHPGSRSRASSRAKHGDLRGDLRGGLAWVLTVHRLATLCSLCRTPVLPSPEELEEFCSRFPDLDLASEGARFYRAPGCPHCGQSGRAGEVAAVDICLIDADAADPRAQSSILPLEAYLLGLARQGHLALGDVLRFDADRLEGTCKLLTATERALSETNAELERKAAELGAATQVLQQRTEALIALEGIGQALIASASLDELAQRLCRNARDLCGADRAILYYRGAEEPQLPPRPRPFPEESGEIGEPLPDSTAAPAVMAEILAVVGWDPVLVHQPVDAALVFGNRVLAPGRGIDPMPDNRWPPGVPRRLTDVTASALRAGLRVPLVAQDRQVGLMIVHTSQKHGFSPGAVALLQTFANQAAVAIQRAGLVDALQGKILQLQEAQAQLLQKERMERELELARQVQQGILPRIFPQVPGFTFAARNEPARQVGGDLYDVFPLDRDHIGLVVGDVSGKGLPAALHMSRVHSLLRAESRHLATVSPDGLRSRVSTMQPSPCATLTNVHRLLQELGESDMFVTVFFGVLACPGIVREHSDRPGVGACPERSERALRTYRLTYARAGHDRPLLLRGGQVLSLGGEGTVLGFPGLDELYLSDEYVDLVPGDRLVLYTDGLVDACSPSGRAFGRERLSALLRSFGSLPAGEVCTRVFTAVEAFQEGAERYDDLTVLVLSVDSICNPAGAAELSGV